MTYKTALKVLHPNHSATDSLLVPASIIFHQRQLVFTTPAPFTFAAKSSPLPCHHLSSRIHQLHIMSGTRQSSTKNWEQNNSDKKHQSPPREEEQASALPPPPLAGADEEPTPPPPSPAHLGYLVNGDKEHEAPPPKEDSDQPMDMKDI